jgi:cation:H+ antiporter
MPRTQAKRASVPIALQVIFALLLLVLASDAFTNAVEWIGALFGLTRSAVGAIVAAIGSSLPETMVAFIALVLLADPSSQAIGIGAVIGAPLMLSTVVFCLIGVGAIVLGKRHDTVEAPARPVIVGLALFSCTFALVIGASFAPTFAVRVGAAALALGAYAAYLIYHMRLRLLESDESPARLRISPRAQRPALGLVLLQLAIATVLTAVAARWFVASLASLSEVLAVSPLLISILLSPIATELPEVLNSVIWMRRDLDDLALGNVIGAMMFQTSIAGAIGLLATPWVLDGVSYRAAAATLAAVVFVIGWTLVRRRIEARPLALCGLIYVGYLAAQFANR